jgi:hypothetical protein
MLAGVVTFHIKQGMMDRAVAMWKNQVLPQGTGQPGFLGAMLLVDSVQNQLIGYGFWQDKAAADAWAVSGPWRPDSPLRREFEAWESGPPTRQEFEVAYLNVPGTA